MRGFLPRFSFGVGALFGCCLEHNLMLQQSTKVILSGAAVLLQVDHPALGIGLKILNPQQTSGSFTIQQFLVGKLVLALSRLQSQRCRDVLIAALLTALSPFAARAFFARMKLGCSFVLSAENEQNKKS